MAREDYPAHVPLVVEYLIHREAPAEPRRIARRLHLSEAQVQEACRFLIDAMYAGAAAIPGVGVTAITLARDDTDEIRAEYLTPVARTVVPRLTHGEWQVLAWLAEAEDDGLSVTDLASLTGYTTRWVYFRLRRLLDLGLVVSSPRPNPSGARSLVSYHLVNPDTTSPGPTE